MDRTLGAWASEPRPYPNGVITAESFAPAFMPDTMVARDSPMGSPTDKAASSKVSSISPRGQHPRLSQTPKIECRLVKRFVPVALAGVLDQHNLFF